MRPDHLSAYGYDVIETPAIDRVAEEGVLFENAVAQAPITPVSHASIFTGLTPRAHGLRNFTRENRLREGSRTLAEILAAKGYRTGAIVAAATVDPVFGLNRGFDTYRLVLPDGFYPFRKAERTLLATLLAQAHLVQDPTVYRPADPQVDDAIAWLERSRGTPFFLWLHLFDAHEPHAPPARGLAPERHPGRTASERRGRAFLYDSEILAMDDALGRLFRRLTALGLDERTLVVVASDHGNGLGNHDYYGHTARLFREQTRMVLLLRWPGRLPEGRRVPAQVRSIDIVPTVLSLLGSSCPPVEGRDLRPWIDGDTDRDLPAFSETMESLDPSGRLQAFDDGRFKLIRTLEGRSWLFDRLRDPGEQLDLSDDPRAPLARLHRALDATLQSTTEAEARLREPERIDPELRERLESLGYLK